MITEIITTDAPGAIGPYSQGIWAGEWLLVSGQIPLDPVSGILVAGGVVEQAEQVMKNLEAILNAAGVGFGNVVKTTIYLVDLKDFAIVNEVYGRYFRPPFPARATIGVAALPRGAVLEIEAVAHREFKDNE